MLPALGFIHSPPSTAWQEVEQQLDGGQRGESARGPVQYVEKTPNPRLKSEWGVCVGGGGIRSWGSPWQGCLQLGVGCCIGGGPTGCAGEPRQVGHGVSVLLGWVGWPSTVRWGLAVGSYQHPRFCCGVLLFAALGTQDEGTAGM